MSMVPAATAAAAIREAEVGRPGRGGSPGPSPDRPGAGRGRNPAQPAALWARAASARPARGGLPWRGPRMKGQATTAGDDGALPHRQSGCAGRRSGPLPPVAAGSAGWNRARPVRRARPNRVLARPQADASALPPPMRHGHPGARAPSAKVVREFPGQPSHLPLKAPPAAFPRQADHHRLRPVNGGRVIATRHFVC